MKETKSNWACVADVMKQQPEIAFGRYVSYCYYKTPRRILHSISYYKFAAKLIGKEKRVLDVGCNEGIGTWVLAKECGFAKGVDFDAQAIETAKSNFPYPNIQFSAGDIFEGNPNEPWDAVLNFDVIEHIYPEHAEQFMGKLKSHVSDTGLVVIGTPSLVSQQFASEIAKKGHVNVYSPQRLEEMMARHFEFVFLFAANDEVVHTGYLPLAHYLIAIGCKKRIVS
ncbi:MAG TPA: class I SAM-dependent methyltransferase [Chlamydiales bacterium]|nr:class I SAM-dependent methyltransferase [Chlamydiales bacterium]